MNLGLVTPPIIKQTNVQDAIQKFADEAASEGNHFKWSDDSNEERGEDVFSLVIDPATLERNTNLPIIAKIPIPYVDTSLGEEINQYTVDDIAKKINEIGMSVGYKIVTRLSTQFSSEIETGGRPFGRTPEDKSQVHRTRSLNVVPFADIINISVFYDNQEVNDLKAGSDFLNVRMRFKIKIDSNLQTEQEIMNVLNFMDRIGSGEEYEKLLTLASNTFKEVFSSVDPMYSHYFQDAERKRIARIDKAASQPISTSTIPKPPSIDISRSPLFSGNPATQGQHMNENNKKKLVINERFKRLLRNIKK
jgi:hypothetical protein